MAAPDITCVIPIFNNREQFALAARSALAQEGVSVEVILVDDCSDAETRAAIERFAAGEDRVRVFQMPRNAGQGQARNVGAALAQGRFLAFLDQDDEHLPGWYAAAARVLDDRPGLGAISGVARVVDLPARLAHRQDDLSIRGLSNVFVTNILFRTSLFRASGGFPVDAVWRQPRAGEDSVYREQFAHCVRAGAIDQPALMHRAREGGATVHFLDRSEVRGDRVVLTRYDDIEKNGALQEAHAMFTRHMAATFDVVWACAPDGTP